MKIPLCRRSLPVVFCLVPAFVLCGCGSAEDVPPLGQVSGTVTVDGKTIKNLDVVFEPVISETETAGRSSTGVTDAEGKYTLYYKADLPGAVIGEHTVRVSQADLAEVPPEDVVNIPASFSAESTLKKTVKEGENPIDITIETGQ